MRDAFEAWARTANFLPLDCWSNDNEYKNPSTCLAWMAWQAAIKSLRDEVLSATVVSDNEFHRLSICYSSREAAERALDALFTEDGEE